MSEDLIHNLMLFFRKNHQKKEEEAKEKEKDDDDEETLELQANSLFRLSFNLSLEMSFNLSLGFLRRVFSSSSNSHRNSPSTPQWRIICVSLSRRSLRTSKMLFNPL